MWIDRGYLEARRAHWGRVLASAQIDKKRAEKECADAEVVVAMYDRRIAALNESAPADADTSSEGMDNQTPAV